MLYQGQTECQWADTSLVSAKYFGDECSSWLRENKILSPNSDFFFFGIKFWKLGLKFSMVTILSILSLVIRFIV